MRSIVLSRRLRTAVESIGRCRCLADIGCDHGKAVVYCVSEGIADKAIAIDIAAPSLDKARRLAAARDVAVSCRLGDGMAPLAVGEADCVMIAGMGGIEIDSILSQAAYAPEKLVLVPHRNAERVRRRLTLCDYDIVKDVIVEDAGHWYPVIVAVATDRTVIRGGDSGDEQTGGGLYVGQQYADSEGYAVYRSERMRRLQTIMDKGSTDPAIRCEWSQLNKTLPKEVKE